MANRNRFPTSRSRGGSRPNRAWSGIASVGFTGVGVSAKVILGSFALSSDAIDETILRTVGMLAVESDQSAAVEDQIGAFGMIRVTENAFAVGITAVPGPVTDINDDGWLLMVPFAQSGASVLAAGPSSVQYPFDSKAKRVVEGGIRAVIVVENASASHVFQVAFVMRLLAQVRGTR